jgi:hypothetical protein
VAGRPLPLPRREGMFVNCGRHTISSAQNSQRGAFNATGGGDNDSELTSRLGAAVGISLAAVACQAYAAQEVAYNDRLDDLCRQSQSGGVPAAPTAPGVGGGIGRTCAKAAVDALLTGCREAVCAEHIHLLPLATLPDHAPGCARPQHRLFPLSSPPACVAVCASSKLLAGIRLGWGCFSWCQRAPGEGPAAAVSQTDVCAAT